MSATLPDINLLKENLEIPHLIKNYDFYFNLKYFKRNQFVKKYDINNKETLLTEIKKIKDNKNKILVVLNTVKSSINFFNHIKNEFKNVLLLNSYITNNEKNKIINFVKNNDDIVVVSTQSIEAGVDLDFDYGFRDLATIDSIEQTAGRINRESNLDKINTSKLFIINYENDSSKIYRNNNEKFEIFKELKEENKVLDILNNKKFTEYYKIYLKNIKISEFKHIYFSLYDFEELNKLNVFKTLLNESFLFKELKSNSIELIDKIVENSLENFDRKEYNKHYYKLLNENSLSLNFFTNDDYEKFIDYLNSNNYIEEYKGFQLINNNFKNKYYNYYKVKDLKINYFNISEIMEDFKSWKNSTELEDIIF